MPAREESPLPPSRPPSARADESFFAHTAACDEWPKTTQGTQRPPARERAVTVGVELAPVGDQALRCTADAVGLSATALLRAIVIRLCREVETGAHRPPLAPNPQGPAQEEAPGSTRVLRRVPLRRPDAHVLRRGAAAMGGTPSALVARRIDCIAGYIDAGDTPDRPADPIDTYRRLLAVLHGGGQA